MHRRGFLIGSLGSLLTARITMAARQGQFDDANAHLAAAVESGKIDAAALYIRHRDTVFANNYGRSRSADDMFLLASITKTMSTAAVMTLYDRQELRLDDPVREHIPEFVDDGRDEITVRQLLTHVSGLPDQLPENAQLRKSHAPLQTFIEHAIRTPLLFAPGSRYSYSSMAILLATEIAQRISGQNFLKFIDQALFTPLGMKRSVLGLGKYDRGDVIMNQIQQAATESGAGDPTARDWDWNSEYWRRFGAPWGGAHGSAADVARFLDSFLYADGKALKPGTARLIIQNHNRSGLTPRGLGFAVGARAGSPGCSEATFGHTGSTGTLCWADPATDTVCVVLTTLPGRAMNPHPRTLTSDAVAKAVAGAVGTR